MPNIRVALKKREYVEYFVSSMIEVSEQELSQIQNRPLQAKYWAENVAVYRIDKDAWSALDDGRKTFSVEAIEVEVAQSDKPEQVVDATLAYRLLANGWSVQKVSLYDEEGVDGWRWDGPYGQEYTVIGDWDGFPPIPEELRT